MIYGHKKVTILILTIEKRKQNKQRLKKEREKIKNKKKGIKNCREIILQ